MKIIMKILPLWLIPLSIYILEIAWVCIKGTNLVNNLIAWICCICLFLVIAIPSVVRLYKSEKELKEIEKRLREKSNDEESK